MNHIELHKELCDTFKKLKRGRIDKNQAKELFNGAGKIINNCRNELVAINMGVPMDVPLLEITKEESKIMLGSSPRLIK